MMARAICYNIYKITNINNGLIYVGRHNWDNPNYYGSGKNIKKAIKAEGKENFRRIVIEYCDSFEELIEVEPFWIENLDTRNPKVGYNITVGGDGWGNNGCNFSEEWRKNIGKSQLGKHHSKETKEKMSQISKEYVAKNGHNWQGQKHSEETKEKIRQWNLGRKMPEYAVEKLRNRVVSEETRKKIGASSKGRIPTEETKQKMSEAHKKRWAKINKKKRVVSPETRKKMSEARLGKEPWNKGKHHSDETKEKLSIATKKQFAEQGHPFEGKHHSNETKEKIRLKLKGQKLSEKTRKKMSESRTGKKRGKYKKSK